MAQQRYVVIIASESRPHPDHDPELQPGDEGYAPPVTPGAYLLSSRPAMERFAATHLPHASVQVMPLFDPSEAPDRDG